MLPLTHTKAQAPPDVLGVLDRDTRCRLPGRHNVVCSLLLLVWLGHPRVLRLLLGQRDLQRLSLGLPSLARVASIVLQACTVQAAEWWF